MADLTLSENEQRAILANPQAIALLMIHHDVQQDQADNMGFECRGNAIRYEELKAHGRAIVEQDPDVWDDETLRAFGVTRGVLVVQPAEPDEDEQWAIDRGADLLEHYAEYIRRVKPEDIEQHPYLPELESVAEHLRALSRRRTSGLGIPTPPDWTDDAMCLSELADRLEQESTDESDRGNDSAAAAWSCRAYELRQIVSKMVRSNAGVKEVDRG